jgi:hypothetical protein
MTGHPAGDCVGTRSIVYLRLVIAVCVCVSQKHIWAYSNGFNVAVSLTGRRYFS